MNAFDRPKPRPPTQAAEGVPRWRWSIEDFEKMAECGLLTEHDRVELIGGELVPMSPKGPLHERLRSWIGQFLRLTVSPDLLILHEPGWRPDKAQYLEPDFLIVPQSTAPYRTPGPEVRLLIEVSDTTERFDLGTKATVYAALGVPEYWVIKAATRDIVVHRSPQGDAGYRDLVTIRGGASIQAVAIPELVLDPEELPADAE